MGFGAPCSAPCACAPPVLSTHPDGHAILSVRLCGVRRHLAWGRVVIVVLAAVGLLPLIMDVKALDATTVSGLVVMGLAPPIVLLLFTDGYRPLTFHLPFWWCARRILNFPRASLLTMGSCANLACPRCMLRQRRRRENIAQHSEHVCGVPRSGLAVLDGYHHMCPLDTK